jgi:integrase/recombinase XerD
MKIFTLEDTVGNLQQYQDYLRNDRGLSEHSVLVYVPHIRDFLAIHVKQPSGFSPHALDALTIRNHIVDRTPGRSNEYRRLLAVSLRSFFRFLFLYGHAKDLSASVPVVRKYRQSVPPVFLSPTEVEHTLLAIDR